MIRGKVLSPLKPSPKNSFWLATFVIYCRNRERFMFFIDMLALKKKNKDRRFIFKFLVAFFFLFNFLYGFFLFFFFLLLVKRHKCLSRKQIKEIWVCVCVSENSPPHFCVCVWVRTHLLIFVCVSEWELTFWFVFVCVCEWERTHLLICVYEWERELTSLPPFRPITHRTIF